MARIRTHTARLLLPACVVAPRSPVTGRGAAPSPGMKRPGKQPRAQRTLPATWLLAAVLAHTGLPPPAPAQQAEPAAARVQVRDGLLSVEQSDAPLGEVLRAIAAEAGFVVVIDGELDPGEPRSVLDLPLEEGLRRLLDGVSFVIVHGAPGDPVGISELRVYPDATGAAAPAGTRPRARTAEQGPEGPLAKWVRERLRSTDRGTRIVAVRRLPELQTATALNIAETLLRSEPDAAVRGQVAATLGRLEGEDVAAVLFVAADDTDTSVRIHTANAAARVGGAGAVEVLGRMALSDADGKVRLAAVVALARVDSEQAQGFLELAAEDDDAQVRGAATAILQRARPDTAPDQGTR